MVIIPVFKTIAEVSIHLAVQIKMINNKITCISSKDKSKDEGKVNIMLMTKKINFSPKDMLLHLEAVTQTCSVKKVSGLQLY